MTLSISVKLLNSGDDVQWANWHTHTHTKKLVFQTDCTLFLAKKFRTRANYCHNKYWPTTDCLIGSRAGIHFAKCFAFVVYLFSSPSEYCFFAICPFHSPIWLYLNSHLAHTLGVQSAVQMLAVTFKDNSSSSRSSNSIPQLQQWCTMAVHSLQIVNWC